MLSRITTLILLLAALQASARVLCVDSHATNNGSGQNWKVPFSNLQNALDAAKAGDQVWVKAGSYSLPEDGFSWPREVAVYGGFIGKEKSANDRAAYSYSVLVRGTECTAPNFIHDKADNGRFIIDGFMMIDEGATAVNHLFSLTAEGDVIIDNVLTEDIEVAVALLSKIHVKGNVKMSGCKWMGVSTKKVLFAVNGDFLLTNCAFCERTYDNPLFDVTGSVVARNIEVDGVLWSEAGGPF